MEHTNPDHNRAGITYRASTLIERSILAAIEDAETYAALYYGPERPGTTDGALFASHSSFRYWRDVEQELRQALTEYREATR